VVRHQLRIISVQCGEFKARILVRKLARGFERLYERLHGFQAGGVNRWQAVAESGC
jgi:hypothetical protein